MFIRVCPLNSGTERRSEGGLVAQTASNERGTNPWNIARKASTGGFGGRNSPGTHSGGGFDVKPRRGSHVPFGGGRTTGGDEGGSYGEARPGGERKRKEEWRKDSLRGLKGGRAGGETGKRKDGPQSASIVGRWQGAEKAVRAKTTCSCKNFPSKRKRSRAVSG